MQKKITAATTTVIYTQQILKYKKDLNIIIHNKLNKCKEEFLCFMKKVYLRLNQRRQS